MRIPTDISLATYIRQLIRDNNIIQFYKSNDWKELRREVLEDYHNECQECLKRGRVRRADCVHHVNEVRVRPELALSKTYIDAHGQEQAQLVPLCNDCHNDVHDKLGILAKGKRFENKERW